MTDIASEDMMAKILIVEDDPSIRALYAAALKKRGYTVDEAKDGEEALECLPDSKPDLIILDILMPNASGIVFLKAADIATNYPNTKVLIASNVDNAQYAKELSRFGVVSHYIVKAEYTPYQVVDLVDKLLA